MLLCPSHSKDSGLSWSVLNLSCCGECFLIMCLLLSMYLSFVSLSFCFISSVCFMHVCLFELHSLWHYVLFLHFHIVKVFMLVYLSKAVYQFVQSVVCLWSISFQHLLPDVVFHWYWGGPDMFLHSGDCALNLHHLDLLASAIVVFHPCPAKVPCIHNPPSSHCTATIDPISKEKMHAHPIILSMQCTCV